MWYEYGFMRLALLAIAGIAPMFAFVGTLVVDGRMAFFSDSLAHAALCGIGIGVLLGVPDPFLAMTGFAVCMAVLLVAVKNKGAAGADTAIGVFSSTAVALGIVLLSRGGGFARYTYVLVGDLLSVSGRDVAQLMAILAAAGVALGVLYNRLALTQLSRPLSMSRSGRVWWLEAAFGALVALVVMAGIRWVGALIVNALMVLPAAGARNIARTTRGYVLLAMGLALACGAAGVIWSYSLGSASGATVVLLLAAAYAASLPFAGRSR